MRNFDMLESQGDTQICETVYINGKLITLTEDPEGDGEEENATDD